MNSKSKLWTKDFIMVSASNFLLFVSFYLLMVTLAMYSIEQFQVSGSIAGLASSIFVLGAVVVRPMVGNLLARIGMKKLLVFGLVLFFFVTILYFPINSIGWMLLIRFIHGFAFGISSTATGTIAVDVIPPSRRGEGMGYFATSNNLAMSIGPFIGLMTLQYFSGDTIFIITTIISITALLTALYMKVPEVKVNYIEKTRKQKFHINDYFEKSAYPISILMLILGIANSSILSFINAYSVEINLVSAASFFFVMYAVFLLMSRPITGRLYDKKGENSVIYPAIALFGLGLIVLSQASSGIALLVAGAIIGVGFGTLQSSAQTIAVSGVPHARVGLATSTFYVFYDLGMGMGPFLLGYVMQVTGFRGLYLAMSVIAFLALPLYYFLHGKKKRKQTNQIKEAA
mgnify:CR=1 FL=1